MLRNISSSMPRPSWPFRLPPQDHNWPVLSRAMEGSRLGFLRSQVGRRELVLIEREVGPGIWEGLTANYTPVRVESSRELAGEILPVRITGAGDGYCAGEVIDMPGDK